MQKGTGTYLLSWRLTYVVAVVMTALRTGVDDVVFISLLIPCTFGIEGFSRDVITSIPRK